MSTNTDYNTFPVDGNSSNWHYTKIEKDQESLVSRYMSNDQTLTTDEKMQALSILEIRSERESEEERKFTACVHAHIEETKEQTQIEQKEFEHRMDLKINQLKNRVGSSPVRSIVNILQWIWDSICAVFQHMKTFAVFCVTFTWNRLQESGSFCLRTIRERPGAALVGSIAILVIGATAYGISKMEEGTPS